MPQDAHNDRWPIGSGRGQTRREERIILPKESKNDLLRRLRRAFAWGRLKLPFGLRTVSGVLLLLGGVLGFLPVLGFWMIPLGAALIALDVPPLRRRLRAWLHRVVPPRRQWRGRPRIGQRKDHG